MFDIHFLVDEDDRNNVNTLLTNLYDSCTKQQEVSDDPAALRTGDFRKDALGEKEALRSLVDRIAVLNPTALPSDRNDTMQKCFLRSTVSRTDWELDDERGAHHKRATTIILTHLLLQSDP